MRTHRTWTRWCSLIKCGATVRLLPCRRLRAYPTPHRLTQLRDGHCERLPCCVAALRAEACTLRRLRADSACCAVRYKLDNLNREYNTLNKAVAKLKIVRGVQRASRCARSLALEGF